jgi:hypothetical protein
MVCVRIFASNGAGDMLDYCRVNADPHVSTVGFYVLASGATMDISVFDLHSCFDLSPCGRYTLRVEYDDPMRNRPSGEAVAPSGPAWVEYAVDIL